MHSPTRRPWSLLAACLLLVPLLSAPAAAASDTQTLMLSGHGPEDAVAWDFYCTGGRNSGEWTTIPVPSCWEQQGFGTYNYGVNHRPGRDRPNPPPLADEQGLYRREFEVPADWQGRRVRVVFDGVMTDAEVRINGRSAGPVHQGAFYRFDYDITSLLHFGATNRIEVTVSKKSANESVNRAERIGDYWTFGGIFRPVWLEARPAEAIDRVAIDARADGSFAAEVFLVDPASTGGEVETEILDASGRTVATLASAKINAGAITASATGSLNHAEPWSAETPNLYAARFTLKTGGGEPHVVTRRFGFRTFEVRPEDGLYLNGVKIRLKGINRHCFWPETGRTLSRAQSYADARVIKDANMNAVRMSHYPPDAHFLEACDELGLYVLDELAGWQGSYDTPTATRLVGELIRRDVNHPSILFWDNGNEGGWNTAVDGEFAKWDPQHRPVLHPWEKFSGIDTNHYEAWDSHLNLTKGPMIYMPTEILHGLYDGGQGAALRDYWNAITTSPTAAGMFFWSFADEGVVRTDENGRIDTAGNLAPDGIVGPHHEREGSYYAVKEIWSPMTLDLPETIAPDWNGALHIANNHDFTRLDACKLRWTLLRDKGPDSVALSALDAGAIELPAIEPHQSGEIRFALPALAKQGDVIHLTATGPNGEELWTWSSTVVGAASEVGRVAPNAPSDLKRAVEPRAGFSPTLIVYSREKKKLVEVPIPDAALKVEWHSLGKSTWRLDYSYELEGAFDLVGVRLLGPGMHPVSKRWLGRGPYRVWQNRMEGGVLGVYELAYNDSTPGESWAYPEFNGFFRDWRWISIKTGSDNFVVENTSGVPFVGLGKPRDGVNGVLDVPDVGVAVLDVIPPIGTKFTTAEVMGPQSQTRTIGGLHSGSVVIRLSPP